MAVHGCDQSVWRGQRQPIKFHVAAAAALAACSCASTRLPVCWTLDSTVINRTPPVPACASNSPFGTELHKEEQDRRVPSSMQAAGGSAASPCRSCL